jgi:hypothetical protein
MHESPRAASGGAGLISPASGGMIWLIQFSNSQGNSVARRHCEKRSDEAIHSFLAWRNGLLRFARNDGI